MPFVINTTTTAQSSDGVLLSKQISNLSLNAKVVLDDVFGPGPVTVDLAPYLASIANPRGCYVLLSGDGAKLKFDGAAAFTAKAYKQVFLEITDGITPGPPGVLDLELELLGQAQRLQVFAWGDP
jgi:hypothetical protein